MHSHGNFFTGLFFYLDSRLRPQLICYRKSWIFSTRGCSGSRAQIKTVDGLVILPVVINDTVRVNLILDTGCRNLVLFGKKFQKLFKTEQDKKLQFSGLGVGDAITGELSLNNKVSIEAVIRENI